MERDWLASVMRGLANSCREEYPAASCVLFGLASCVRNRNEMELAGYIYPWLVAEKRRVEAELRVRQAGDDD